MIKPKTLKQKTGSLGEKIACEYLKRRGFRILETNYRKSWGEIDIIALKEEIVRFIEVKTVSRESDGSISREMDYRPEEMVTSRKLEKVARTASLFMESKKDSREYQIDVLGVILDHARREARCRLFEQVL